MGLASCGRTTGQNEPVITPSATTEEHLEVQDKAPLEIITGANRLSVYLPLLKNKKIGLVGNQSSVIFDKDKTSYTHLVDSLLSLHVNLVKVFAPEHGFRGTADAGEAIQDGKDPATGLDVISLYGNNKKPTPEQLEGLDLLIFDIQDVGARFYTYISSLHYVMEACAENNISLLILDRPNPNGHYIDGPVLNLEHQSFVGMHPIPIVHGLTMGEYAKMINGEKWLKNGLQCKLEIVKMEHYTHSTPYSLPIKPSPNLPNDNSINLYPSLCFFEGTNVNAGRGTQKQFQVFGSPFLDKNFFDFSYTPASLPGAKDPKHLGKVCYGMDLSEAPRINKINLSWLIDAYKHTANKREFFNSFFTKLAGNTQLQRQIEEGFSEEQIRETWASGLKDFEKMRKKYLIYPKH